MCGFTLDRNRKMLFFITLLSLIVALARTLPNGQTHSTTTFSTDKLPTVGPLLDYRILPYIGNGHLATVVYSDVVYMGGLYNGDNG